MFKKLFKRANATPAPAMPATIPVVSKERNLETFREEWEDKWETSHEVIEGNGGNTDWGAWTDAVKDEENAFADTVIEDEDSIAPTLPMPLEPQ